MTVHTTLKLTNGDIHQGVPVVLDAGQTLDTYAEYSRQVFKEQLNTQGAVKMPLADGTIVVCSAMDVASMVFHVDAA